MSGIDNDEIERQRKLFKERNIARERDIGDDTAQLLQKNPVFEYNEYEHYNFENDEGIENPNVFSFKNYLLVKMLLVTALANSAYSIIAPFVPIEAESREIE